MLTRVVTEIHPGWNPINSLYGVVASLHRPLQIGEYHQFYVFDEHHVDEHSPRKLDSKARLRKCLRQMKI